MAVLSIAVRTLLVHLALSIYSYKAPRASSPSFHERLQAQGLLGSHFGQVDILASYDYVVVGGGTAGLTIARRLAEYHTVAVIEAGSFYELDNGNFTEIPADASYYLGKDPGIQNPRIDWRQQNYATEWFRRRFGALSTGKDFRGQQH